MPKGVYDHINLRGSKHGCWKGNSVGYSGIHIWISKSYGRPLKCEDCGMTEIPKGLKQWFEWANISGEYKRDRSDWKRLCKKCHDKMDMHLKPRGEKQGLSKLKNVDIPLICELLSNSQISLKRIGQIFGVGENAIRCIDNKKTWKHIISQNFYGRSKQ